MYYYQIISFSTACYPQKASSLGSRGGCRHYASLTKEQKEKLSEGPGLEDFIHNDVPHYEGKGSIKRVKGQRFVFVCMPA